MQHIFYRDIINNGRETNLEYEKIYTGTISEQIEIDKNFLNRQFYIHSVLRGSGADNQNLWPRCWIRFVNGKAPENLVKLYIMLRAQRKSNIIYTCWSSKDHLLTQNYHTKLNVTKKKIYLKSINFIKPELKEIYLAKY